MWFVSNKFLGTKRHLLVSSKNLQWVEKIDPHILGYAYSKFHPFSLSSFLRISAESTPHLLPENIRKSLDICNISFEQSGAGFLMRPAELQKRIVDFVEEVGCLFEPLLPYLETYVQNIEVLSRCLPAHYSVELLKEVNHAGKITLDESGHAPKPIYSLSHSKTGRMTIVGGAQILTTPRELKHCIRSRFKNGTIIEIDYSALEPRTALAVIGSGLASSPDIYEHVAKIFSPGLPRETAKQVTISFLYGAAKNTIRRLIGTSKDIDSELQKLKKLFGFEKIVTQAEIEIQKNGYFKNHAGRPIRVDSIKRGLLFNNFCQSTAVDVALSGFANLLDEMQATNFQAVPLYFIHDAIILDVPAEELDRLEKISFSLPTCLGIDFPTKMKILNN